MNIVIFGNRNFASVAWHCLQYESPHRPVGFTVDSEFMTSSRLHDLPAVAFETIEATFPAVDHALLIPLGAADANRLRQQKCAEARDKGYRLISWVSPNAIVAANVPIRDNCMVFEGAVIQPFCEIGENVIVRNGCQISHHVAIGDNCFVAGGAVIGGGTRIGQNCMLGLNSTVLDGVEIAPHTIVGAGAVVTRNIASSGTYVGVPARKITSG